MSIFRPFVIRIILDSVLGNMYLFIPAFDFLVPARKVMNESNRV